jgi:hypothetical protein
MKPGTAEALEVIREHEDSVDANLIGEMIGGDPLVTLKVLAFGSKNRPARVLTQPETVTPAVARCVFARPAGYLGRIEQGLTSCESVSQLFVGIRATPTGPRRRRDSPGRAASRLCGTSLVVPRAGSGTFPEPEPDPPPSPGGSVVEQMQCW